MLSLVSRWMRPAAKAGALVFHLPTGLELAGLLKRLDLQLDPDSRYRWARGVQKVCGGYLCREFSVADRLDALVHHYQQSFLGGPSFTGPTTVFRREADVGVVELVLDRATVTKKEGECVLEYRWNGTWLYRLTFTIVPRRLVPGASGDVLFIGGSQGARRATSDFREASKSHSDLCPTFVAFYGLQVVAERWGLGAIVATRADRSVAGGLSGVRDHSLYDQFWETLGGEDRGWFYRLPTTPLGKDLALVPSHHRRRARKRQELRWEMHQSIRKYGQEGAVLAANGGPENREPQPNARG